MLSLSIFFTIRETLIVSAFIYEKCECLHSFQLWDISNNVNCWRKFASLSLCLSPGELVDIVFFFHLRSFIRLENCEPLRKKKSFIKQITKATIEISFFFVIIFHPSYGCIVIKQRKFCLHRHWMKCKNAI